MTSPEPRGCILRPAGPLTAGDLRLLVKRMDDLQLSNHAAVDMTTPLAPHDRRAVTIRVIEHPPANVIDAEPDDDAPHTSELPPGSPLDHITYTAEDPNTNG